MTTSANYATPLRIRATRYPAYMANCREVYVAVWDRAESRGAFVHYDRFLPLQGDGRDGYFYPYEDEDEEHKAEPKIHIARARTSGKRPKLDGVTDHRVVAELHTLTHETGHFLWWHRGWHDDAVARAEITEYRVAARLFDQVFEDTKRTPNATSLSDDDYTRMLAANMQRELTDEQRRLILVEEERAWTLGRELLVEFGYDGLEAYDTRAVDGVYGYRVKLGHEPVV